MFRRAKKPRKTAPKRHCWHIRLAADTAAELYATCCNCGAEWSERYVRSVNPNHGPHVETQYEWHMQETGAEWQSACPGSP